MTSVNPDQLDLRLSFLRPIHAGAYEKMTASLARYGQLTPVIVIAENDRMILIDGFKRLRSAKRLGMKTLMVTTVAADSCQAKALVYLLNRAAGFSIIAEALLVRDLIEVEGLNQVETATLLERNKSWVHRRLAMIRALAPQIADDIRLNLLPAGVASSLARLPHETQTDFCAVIQMHGLKSREVKKLVDIWCKAKDPGIRQSLLKSPQEALRIAGQTPREYLSVINTLLAKIGALNRQLKQAQLSPAIAQILLEYLGLMQAQIEKTRKLIVDRGKHEPSE
jgi:ParB-like chromosome segregation protein Spo0J